MEDSRNQVKLLIWPSKKKDPHRSVDRDGHVELCVFDTSYGLLPDYSKMSSYKELIKGCKGMLRPLHLVDLATWYFIRVREEREEDILNPSRHKHLPIMWSFAFEASDQSVQKLVGFLKSKINNPPLYAYRADQPGSHNCQTMSREALKVSRIFDEPSFTSASPDDLLDLLLQKKNSTSIIADTKKSQLTPPSFITIGGA